MKMQNNKDPSKIGTKIGMTSDGRLVLEMRLGEISAVQADEWHEYNEFYVRAKPITGMASPNPVIFRTIKGVVDIGDMIMMSVPVYTGIWLITEVNVNPHCPNSPRLTGRRIKMEDIEIAALEY